jgi:aminopeptidase N
VVGSTRTADLRSLLPSPSDTAASDERRYDRTPLRFYEHKLSAPFPFAKCDILFVPGFPGLAFSAPGLIAINEEILSPAWNDDTKLPLALVIAHELAHAGIGGQASIISAGQIDMWLVEALATYVSRTALQAITPSAQPWAVPAGTAPPDHGYAANAEIIRRLESLIGQDAVLAGLASFLRQHNYGDATPSDLVRCWSEHAGYDAIRRMTRCDLLDDDRP